MPTSHLHGSTIIPCLRYRDAHAAIEWLCKAFGFEKQAVYENENGGVEHAQLTFGHGMVMLGEVRDNEFGRHIAQPDEIGGRETQCACVIVGNCKSHYQQAKAAGAVIVDEYAEKDYGGAGYSCHDPEGHLWYFGSYDPWQPGPA
ncbi:glyoxalase [Rhodanobacter sp. FW510-R12]|uniref:VOC family protein n=1 Tax=unclassified Rhodanobacter TaxID=2621553 RepID=UPI0007AA519D|nr:MULTISPECIES: VOC family protein [unclassified Rhodanobacter]KZC15768.1 glyoxalase [Rhodanobacter sp. FW104-R8]KZC28365.1 glyoxalase [Rhodanobacter sp. FW510-T8]KZC32741.1 glyoxalase [Rhodanobacter sp. FW510-R10]